MRVVQSAKSIQPWGLSAVERIEAFIASTIRTYFGNYPQFFVVTQEDMSEAAPSDSQWSRDLHRQVRDFQTTLESMLLDGIEDGAFRPDLDVWLVAKALWGMLNWTSRWYSPEGASTAQEVTHVFSELFLHGLSAQPEQESQPVGTPDE